MTNAQTLPSVFHVCSRKIANDTQKISTRPRLSFLSTAIFNSDMFIRCVNAYTARLATESYLGEVSRFRLAVKPGAEWSSH